MASHVCLHLLTKPLIFAFFSDVHGFLTAQFLEVSAKLSTKTGILAARTDRFDLGGKLTPNLASLSKLNQQPKPKERMTGSKVDRQWPIRLRCT